MKTPRYSKSLVDSWINEQEYYQCIQLIERSADFDEDSENFGIDEEFYLVWMMTAWVGLACRSGTQQFYVSYKEHSEKVSTLLRKYGLDELAKIFDLGDHDPEDSESMDQIDQWIYANANIVHRFAFEYFNQNRSMVYTYVKCGAG